MERSAPPVSLYIYIPQTLRSTTNQIYSNFIGLYELFHFLFPYHGCYKTGRQQQHRNGQQRQSSMPPAHFSTAKQQHRLARLQNEIKLVRTIHVRLKK